MREKIVPIEVTPEMMKMLEICKKNKSINPELYTKYDVKRGLRDINGKGVLAGLTEIGEIHAYDTLSDGSSKPFVADKTFNKVLDIIAVIIKFTVTRF